MEYPVNLGVLHADDHDLIEHEFPVYDALYAYCQQLVARGIDAP